MTTIEDVIARIPEWQGRSLIVRPLRGGLTNSNYRVDVDTSSYVVRLPGQNVSLLAIDLEHGYRNTLVAAEIGVGARVVHDLPALSVMVLEFVDGSTLTSQAVHAPGMIPRLVRIVRQLHDGPLFANTFNLFRTMDAYLATVQRLGRTLPDGYRSAVTIARRMEVTLEARPLPLRSCHNDLMPENFIDEGRRLRLVDYDYSGVNDPCCDLGYLSNEGMFTPDQTEQMCAAYFGHASQNMLARVWLYRCMTNLVSTLWGTIQHRVSTVAHDYEELARERWHRAQDLMESSEFGSWLRNAR